GTLIAQRVGQSDPERNVPADDAVAPEKSVLGVEEVHRPALALDQSGPLPEELGHHGFGLGPEEDRMGIVAVSGDNPVAFLLAEAMGVSGGAPLFAEVDGEVAADLAGAEPPQASLLEEPNEHHLTVVIEQDGRFDPVRTRRGRAVGTRRPGYAPAPFLPRALR